MAVSVIVVEDDFDSLEVLSEYLSLKDLNVLAKAKNGKQNGPSNFSWSAPFSPPKSSTTPRQAAGRYAS